MITMPTDQGKQNCAMNKEFALPFINEETKLAKNNNNPRERKKSIQNIVCCKCGFLCASNYLIQISVKEFVKIGQTCLLYHCVCSRHHTEKRMDILRKKIMYHNFWKNISLLQKINFFYQEHTDLKLEGTQSSCCYNVCELVCKSFCFSSTIANSFADFCFQTCFKFKAISVNNSTLSQQGNHYFLMF